MLNSKSMCGLANHPLCHRFRNLSRHLLDSRPLPSTPTSAHTHSPTNRIQMYANATKGHKREPYRTWNEKKKKKRKEKPTYPSFRRTFYSNCVCRLSLLLFLLLFFIVFVVYPSPAPLLTTPCSFRWRPRTFAYIASEGSVRPSACNSLLLLLVLDGRVCLACALLDFPLCPFSHY